MDAAQMGSQESHQHYGVLIDHNVIVRAPDETPLATSLYFPAVRGQRATGRFPALMERTPYDRKQASLHRTALFFARHGYVVALQDIRGRGDSGGEYRYLYNPKDEGHDGYNAVEWLATQEWCDGQVGTFGVSHTGATQQALAVCRPPHLATQILGDTAWNYFLKSTQRNGGAMTAQLAVPYPWGMGKSSPEAHRDPALRRLLEEEHVNITELLRRLPIRRGTTALRFIPTYEDWYIDTATRGVYDDYWKNPGGALSDYVAQYPDIPILMYTGWYGHHPWAHFVKYRELRRRLTKPIKLICGPWTHLSLVESTSAGDVDFGLDASLGDLNSLRLKWFDHFMKGYETDVLDGPPIDVFVMGGGDGRRDADGRMRHGGFWRKTVQWPVTECRLVEYYLHRDGSLSRERPGPTELPTSYTYDPQDPVPTIGGNFQDPDPGVKGLSNGGAFDQRGRPELAFCKDTLPLAVRPDVLVFQTDELTAPVGVNGPIVAKLWVSSSAVDTDFTVKLLDVCPPNDDYPYGFHLNLCEAILRMRFRNGFEREELMEPGRVYAIEIELQPTANRFMPRHRIRVDVSSSNFPLWDANRNTGELLGRERRSEIAHQTVYHDASHPSHVVLPIIER